MMAQWEKELADKPDSLRLRPSLAPHGVGRELSPPSCSLTSKYTLWHTHKLPQTSKYIKITKCNTGFKKTEKIKLGKRRE